MTQFKIMAKPVLGSMAPALFRLGFVLLGLVIGLVWAYQIAPVKFENAEPVHLGTNYKDEWIKGAAAEYYTLRVAEQARERVIAAGVTQGRIEKLRDVAAENNDNELRQQLDALLDATFLDQQYGAEVKSQAADQADSVESSAIRNLLFGPVSCFVGTTVIGIILALFMTFYWAVPVGKWAEKKGPAPAGTTSAVSGAGSTHAERVAASRAVAEKKTDFAATGEQPPISQHMSTYILGDDLYDDSFSIETASGEFLGECGSGISETIGVGDPKKVTAIEVWLFDKDDIRTVTKVIMSEHAFNDQALRTKLAPKGEAVKAEPGAVTVLETQSLRLQVRLVDLQYGEGALPPNSFFERFTVELASWPNEDGGGAESDDAPPAPPESTAFGDTSELLNY